MHRGADKHTDIYTDRDINKETGKQTNLLKLFTKASFLNYPNSPWYVHCRLHG